MKTQVRLFLAVFVSGIVFAGGWFVTERLPSSRQPSPAEPFPQAQPRAAEQSQTLAPSDHQVEPTLPSSPQPSSPQAKAKAAPPKNLMKDAAPSPAPYLPSQIAAKLDEELREKPSYDQPGEAMEYYRMKRLPQGETEIPVEKYLAAKTQMDAMPQYSSAQNRYLPSRNEMKANRTEASSEALGTWTPLGPGNVGGRTRALLIHPTTPNVMYAAGVAGGVWKTTNAGARWEPLTDLMANIAVSCLAFDPSNPNTIYAGTGEGFFNGDAVRGAGIFRTTDGGTNWSQLTATNTSDFHYVNDIVMSKANPQRMYAGTRTGVWRSLDSGATWSKVLNYNEGCLDLVIRTDQVTDYLFAACGSFSGGEIFRNTDASGAGVWTSVQKETGMGRTSLALAPSNQNIIYALSANTLSGTFRDGLYAVFRSTSNGDAGTWTAQVRNNNPLKLNTILLTNPLGSFRSECGLGANSFSNQGWYDNVIAVDPLDANRVWVGGIDLFRSDDGGANWGVASYWWPEPSVPQYAHADQHTIVFHPSYNGTSNKQMFIGNDGGIFRTDDARATVVAGVTAPCNPAASGVRWTDLNNNYGVTQFYHGAVFPDGKTYFGGTQDNGTLLGTDANGANGWREIYGGDGGYVAIDPTNPNVLYASLPFGFAFKSTDGGVTFGRTMTGDPNSLFINPLAMDPSNSQRLWAGLGSVMRSAGGGAYWEFAGSFFGKTSTLAVSSLDANYVLVGTSLGSINRNRSALSWNAYNTWFSAAPRSGYVSSVAFDPTNKNICYATYSTFGEKHVYRSTDGGFNYTSIDGNLPDLPVHSIVIDPNNPTRLFIGTDLGVFASTDNGTTWAVENTGFAHAPVEWLTLHTVNGATNLYAFTHGRGVWRVAVGAGNSCSFSLGTPEQTWGPTGGTGSVALNSSGGCAWNASSNADWIVLTGSNSGNGNGTVGYYVAPNTTAEIRVGTITIADKSYVVQQTPVIDRTPPRIQVMTPTTSSAFTTTSPTISIAGTLSDNIGVTRLTWTTDRGMSGDGSVPSPTTWAIQPNLPLANGEHNFTFTAWDAGGNTASITLKVLVQLDTYIVTIAGGGNPPFPGNGDGGPATGARFGDPRRLYFDKAGNLYVADQSESRVRKIAPNGIITTFAGGGTPASAQGDGGLATAASLSSPLSLASDDNGNVYISGGYRIRQVDTNGIIRTIAGTGERAIDFSSNAIIGDGVPALNAKLQEQPGMVVDKSGNLYLADNYRVRKITTATGIITTYAGNGQNAYSGDGGPARDAALRGPGDIAIDSADNIYTSELYWIRKVDSLGIINRIAGNGSFTTLQEGAKALESGIAPGVMTIDKAGVIYFIAPFSQIWKMRTDGILNRVAGGGNPYGGVSSLVNGFHPTTVKLEYLVDVITDDAGKVYFLAYQQVHKIATAGDDVAKPSLAITAPTTAPTLNVTTNTITLRGTASDNIGVTQIIWKSDRVSSGTVQGIADWTINNLPIRVGLNNITVTAFDAAGNAQTATLVVSYNPPQILTTVAGRPIVAKVNPEAGAEALLSLPETVALDGAGNLYIASRGDHRVRKVTRSGLTTIIAGSGQLGSSGDGSLAVNAAMNQPNGVAVDNSGNLYISDTNNHRIRKVNTAGVITTIAGTGIGGFSGDGGSATQAQLNSPVGITLDKDGNLLIADALNHRIRKLNLSTGLIMTVAGNGYGFGGDGGQAAQAQLNYPTSVVFDQNGNLYIADTANHQIRKVTAAGIISRFAGTGFGGFSSDGGTATMAQLRAPGGLAVDAAGALYIADQLNNRVRKVAPDGTMTTIAGNGNVTSQTGDEGSSATNATLNAPAGVAVDGAGNLFIADTNNHRVVVVAAYKSAATVNGASYASTQPVAAEAIVSAFGANLATRDQAVTQLPLPTELAGTSVKVRDSLGVERLASLFYVGKLQVNYQIPVGTAAGFATVTITNGIGEIFTSAVNITTITPGLFTATQNGSGAAAASILYFRNGTPRYESSFACNAQGQNCVARQIDLNAGDEVFLELYGTGIRNNSGLTNVTATVGGVAVPVLYANKQPDFIGLDQVNIRIPKSFAGRGEVDVVLTVDGKAANPVRINIK